ncbi:hypothetical protein V6N13_032978 [Hibiscus sabdariffa]
MHHALLCRSDNNSLLYHHRLHYKDKDEWLIAVEASQTVYSYFDDMRVKWRPSKRLSRFAQRSEWFKHIKDVLRNYFNLLRRYGPLLLMRPATKAYTPIVQRNVSGLPMMARLRFYQIWIKGLHKKDIESRLSIAFPSLYLGMFEILLKYAKDPK